MTGAGVYFAGADATLSIGASGSEVAVAAIHGWSFTISWEVNDLYGSGSIFKIASARYNQKVEVKLKYAKFDPTATFIAGSITGDASTGTTYKGSVYDTTKMFRYNVIGTVDAFTEDDGNVGTDLKVTIANMYLDGVPFSMSENDWVALDLTGIGTSVTIAENT